MAFFATHEHYKKPFQEFFSLSLLYSNAFAKVFEGLLFHKVEVRSRNPIYFDFTLMRYLLRTKAEKLLLCRAINERTFVFLRVEKKDIQSRISVHQTFPPHPSLQSTLNIKIIPAP